MSASEVIQQQIYCGSVERFLFADPRLNQSVTALTTANLYKDSTYEGSNSVPIFKFPRPIRLKAIQVSSITIPYSFYHVPETSCTVTLVRATAQVITFVIPYGNYSTTTFATAFNAAALTAFTAGGYAAESITIALDATNYKYVFTNPAAVTWDFTYVSPSVSTILGLPVQLALNQTPLAAFFRLTAATTTTAPSVVKFGPNYIVLKVRGLPIAPGSVEDFSQSTTLAHFSVNNSWGSIISIRYPLANPIALSGRDIASWTLELQDEFGQALNLNNHPWGVDFIGDFLRS